ncbi:MAG: sulfatase [Persicimonas sp.]
MGSSLGGVFLAAALVAGSSVITTGCSARSADTGEERSARQLSKPSSGLPDGKRAEAKSGKPELDPALPTLEEAHFDAFDLLVNRPLAHRVEHAGSAPTVAVEANAPDFVRYIHGNHTRDWLLGVELDGRKAAGVKAREASVWVPALRPGSAHRLSMRVYNPAQWDNKLSVELNGTDLEPVELHKGWQSVEIDVPADSALRADNELELSFSNLGRIDGTLSGGAIGWIRLGRPAPKTKADGAKASDESKEASREGSSKEGSSGEAPAEKDEQAGAGAAKAADGRGARAADDALEAPGDLPLAQGELTLEPDQGLAWYVWLPEAAKLDMKMSAREGCGVHAEVFVEESGGVASAHAATRELVRGRGETQQTAVDLSEWSGQIARLELRPSDGCEEALTLERAALVVPGEQPSLPEGVEPPERVIVWMSDTLRADHLPMHFDTDVQTPHFERLADEGASFSVAYVQGNESRTSHASFFTGQYPNKHGLVGKGILRPHHHLLSEAIKDHGYKTGIHVANGYVSPKGGFKQGWDHYVNNLREGWRIDGEGVAGHGVDWAKKTAEDPFFLYLGTIDPHVTYRMHEEFIGKYDDPDYKGKYRKYLSGEDLGKIKGGGIKVSGRDKERIINLYKNEISYNDHAFGQLREALEEEDLWEGTMVVITSDHGEEFWEHGSVGHGHNVHQELVHVPILAYYPPLIPEGTVVEAGVDVLDIYPTILEALGAEKPDDVQGKSLLGLIHNLHGGYPEPAIATQYLLHYGMQMQQWKLYLRRGEYQLYDRKSDPLEKTDVAADHPLASRWLIDAMGYFRTHRKEWDKQTWGVPSKVSADFLEKIGATGE